MATADELLSTLDTDKTLIIDKDLRIITIPSSVKNLGVESDDDVLRLKFSMPRMYGDVDLSDFSIYINYMNAKNTGDVYVVDDKTIADDTITFSWLVGRVALAYKGNVRFIVCMKKHDDNSNVIREYNTTIASLPVLEGLETGETVIQQNPDIIEMLLTSSEPLIGTTQTVTPSQVLAAIKAGRDIALQYTDSYYGAFVFSAFNANEKLGIVVSNSILPQWNGLTGTLLGFIEDDAWLFKATNTATKDDVGTAVNEALTAAKASGEFDGADGKSAYSYAQDGGYTGTEQEFAAKLAAEGLDKALYVVNATIDFNSFKLSVDKTFEEIKQAYDEGKYSIILSLMGKSIAPLVGMSSASCVFVAVTAVQRNIVSVTVDTVIITKDNVVETYSADLATTTSKLPNPYPLTFTGAVNETYDGSSAKTIEIPSGGGGGNNELTLLADINFEGNTAQGFEYTDLNDVSEIYIVGAEIKSGLDNSESRFSLKINDIEISAAGVLNIQKASGTDTWNNYYIAKFNGAFWEPLRSPTHAGATPVGQMAAPFYPNSVVLNVGKAKKLYLYVPNPAYKPVTGWMKIWVR